MGKTLVSQCAHRPFRAYMFKKTAAPPNKAAAPTAPVCFGAQLPELDPLPPLPLLLLDEALAMALDLTLLMLEVAITDDGAVTPLVNGTLLTLVASAKPTSVLALVSGVWLAF